MMTHQPTQWVWSVADGVITALVDPADVDEHTARVLYARNMTTLQGVCPECGARVVMPNRRRRRAAAQARVPLRVTVEHADDCPAADQSVPQWHREVTR